LYASISFFVALWLIIYSEFHQTRLLPHTASKIHWRFLHCLSAE
jgi:hypothetical protein